jgi:hypothetical protein
MTNKIILTPFEKAEINKTLHTARMTLCESVQEMISVLIDLRALIDDSRIEPRSDMYDDAMIASMEKEERDITATLVNIASLWEEQGVSAWLGWRSLAMFGYLPRLLSSLAQPGQHGMTGTALSAHAKSDARMYNKSATKE